MHKRQRLEWQSLSRVQRYLETNAKVVGTLNDSPARRQLDDAITHVEEADQRQGAIVREMRGEAALQRSLEAELRGNHMVPMARYARARRKEVPGLSSLTPKLKNVQGRRLVTHAHAVVSAGAQYREMLLEARFPASFLEDAGAAAGAVTASADRWSNLRLERITATKAIALAISSGRSAVAMLDAVVWRFIRGNSALIAGWRDAKRIGAVAGARRVTPRAAPGRKGRGRAGADAAKPRA